MFEQYEMHDEFDTVLTFYNSLERLTATVYGYCGEPTTLLYVRLLLKEMLENNKYVVMATRPRLGSVIGARR